VPAASFDAATMRFGLMFMPDPVASLTRIHRALKPGGSLVLAVWAAAEENPWAALLMDVLRRHLDVPTPPPGTPGIFAMADPDRLRATVTAGGFHDVNVEKLSFTMVDFPTGQEFVNYQMDLAGPIAHLFAQLPESKRALVKAEMAREAEQLGGIPVRLLGLALIATARA